MRILMMAAGYPLPADNGAKRRILASATHLGERHELTLVSLGDAAGGADREPGTPWRSVVVEHETPGRLRTAIRACATLQPHACAKYRSRRLQAVVRRLLMTERFDCVWVHMLAMTPSITTWTGLTAPHRSRPPLLVLDQHNVDEHYFKSFLDSDAPRAWKLYAALEASKAARHQRRTYPRFDAIVCVSREDLRETARHVGPNTRLWLGPNGVDTAHFTPHPRTRDPHPPIVVFGGSFDVAMNVDGAQWLLRDVLPLLRLRVPDVHLCLVGRSPPPALRELAERAGATVTGTVPDVREHYRRASVFVVPVRAGGGTKLKTLEALAMQLPVVSTSVGAQGLDVVSGRHLEIADRADDFAARVAELLGDDARARALGAAGRALAESCYCWSAIVRALDRNLGELCAQCLGRRSPYERAATSN